MRFILLAITLLAAVALPGCSGNSSMMGTAPPAPAVVVDPADGSTGVRLDAAVTLAFAQPADRAVVERGFHVISEREIDNPQCTASTMMTHGTMPDCMADTAMMRHMDVYHATPGRLEWSDDNKVCRFRPDSLMTPVTRHMVHMDAAMMDMMGSGAMSGHGAGMMQGHMMLHFTTMDTTGSGHDDHHP